MGIVDEDPVENSSSFLLPMGKASRWFRGLFGLKPSAGAHNHAQPHKPRKKWSFSKSRKEEDHHHSVVQGGGNDGAGDDASKHAIAVAAAKGAVVQLTSSGRNISVAASVDGKRIREDRAAITIQSLFRAYLSRRALRALRALVRLQALVRGYLVRKQTLYVLRRLEALVRVQARAREAHGARSMEHELAMLKACSTYSSSHDNAILLSKRRSGSKSSTSVKYDPDKDYICVESRMGEIYQKQRSLTRALPTEDDQSAKILQIDTGANQHFNSRRRIAGADQICHTFATTKDPTANQSVLTASCAKAQSLGPLKSVQDRSAYCTAENSPTFYSASSLEGSSSKRGDLTSTNSDCSRSCLSSYYDHHPNYMSYTESSKAKARSASAPKLRPQFDRSSSAKKYSVSTQRGYWHRY